MVRRAHRRPRSGWDFPAHGSRDHALCLDTELLLRRYGMTSVSLGSMVRLTRDADGVFGYYYYDHGRMVGGPCPQPAACALWDAYAPPGDPSQSFVGFDGINIQTTRAEPPGEPELIDFGSYRVCESFVWPLLSTVRDREANWGGAIPLHSPHFVQPDPALALPARYWQEGARVEDPAMSGGEESPSGRFSPVDRLCLQLARDFRAGKASGAAVEASLAAFIGRATAHWPDPVPAERSETRLTPVGG